MHQVLRSTLEPGNESVKKNLMKRNWNRPKILVTFRAGPGTARKHELILEPDPELPENVHQF